MKRFSCTAMALLMATGTAMAGGLHATAGVSYGTSRMVVAGEGIGHGDAYGAWLGILPQGSGVEGRVVFTDHGKNIDQGGYAIRERSLMVQALPKFSLNCDQDDLYAIVGVGMMAVSGMPAAASLGGTVHALPSVNEPAWQAGVGYARHLGDWNRGHWTFRLEGTHTQLANRRLGSVKNDTFLGGIGFVF